MTVWRIHYSDGSSYSSDDGDPYAAPAFDVQVVASEDPTVGRRLDSRYDYWWYEHDAWWGGDLFGVWDYLHRPGPRKVIFGRYVAHDVHQAAMRRALDDPTLPAKSAWDAKEHRPDDEEA